MPTGVSWQEVVRLDSVSCWPVALVRSQRLKRTLQVGHFGFGVSDGLTQQSPRAATRRGAAGRRGDERIAGKPPLSPRAGRGVRTLHARSTPALRLGLHMVNGFSLAARPHGPVLYAACSIFVRG